MEITNSLLPFKYRNIIDLKDDKKPSIAGISDEKNVLIFNEAHRLTNDAKEALLVPTETPPPHLKFIFTTTELNMIPDALRSRFQVHILKK